MQSAYSSATTYLGCRLHLEPRSERMYVPLVGIKPEILQSLG